MGKIGKISPIKKIHDTAGGALKSLGSSLGDNNMNMFPGVNKTLTPYKEPSGAYRTGLDENALYIEAMKRVNPKEAEQEIIRVRELKETLERETGLDLSPRSDYYSKIFENLGSDYTATIVRLYDQDNLFNLDIPQHAITYAWLRVHPEIAPSYTAWEKGLSTYRCKAISQCQFFVNDEEFEAVQEYNQNIKIAKATSIWFNMNNDRRYKVAKLLSLGVGRGSTEEMVYNLGNSYIESSKQSAKTSLNVENFLKIAELADENMNVRFRIAEAFDYNIYRKGKNGVIYEDKERIGDTEQEVIEYFSSPKHQEEFLALQKKIETAKIVEV